MKSSAATVGMGMFALLVGLVQAYIHPITIHGHYFVDSVTKEPFFIKGVDYQPGGSSGVSGAKDPLSDPQECARDILLFQELGINTIRIYSINSELNHDVCMSLLATAGIYLVLDVNSPLPNHHLHRYEPWNSYNVDYLENVFKVVEQFAYYNNTLGFFAGNEIINDYQSAKNSPVYIKAIIRDLKMYIEYNSPRPIPVGYSAADDLKYRIPLAEYLECVDSNPAESVDFYGINSYQWCGEQTFYTSGYNLLVEDYSRYNRPIFFSEYGCNEISPRIFDEVISLYSTDMIDVFSGGLVYEFSQEPNNYGLVELLPNGDIKLLKDFNSLKTQYELLPEINYNYVANSMRKNAKEIQARLKKQKFALPQCDNSYDNLDISKGLPKTIAEDMIEIGVEVARGKYIELDSNMLTPKYNIFEPNGSPHIGEKSIIPVVDIMSGSDVIRKHHIKGFHNCTYNDLEEIEDKLTNYDSILNVMHDSDSDSDSDAESESNSDIDHELKSTDKLTLFKSVSDFFHQIFNTLSS